METQNTKNPELMKSITPDKYVFSAETIRSVGELGAVFKKIHKRLVSEGYIIKNNKILKPKSV